MGIAVKNLAGILIITSLIVACKSNSVSNAKNDTAKAIIIHEEGWPEERMLPTVFASGDTLIHVDFVHAEKGTIASANGILKGKNRVICEVNIGQADSLMAELITEEADKKIYFDHISYPEHQNESPFGNTLRIGIFQPGVYRLFITEGTSESSSLKFRLKLWLK